MFMTLQAHQYEDYPHLLDQMFKLRKRVFHDELKWAVSVRNGQERDGYDDLQPVYLLWISDDATRVYACMRLMPTTGPTLLYDVFRRTFPDAANLVSPGIWEATRTCVDAELIAVDFPGVDQARAFGLLCLAAAECSRLHGIHTVLSNYEPHMKRVYQRSGANIQELGRADGFGQRPVCCGAFEISDAFVESMRAAMDITEPLYERFWSPRRAPVHEVGLAA